MVVFVPEVQNAFVANIGSGTVTVLDLVDLKKITDIVTGAGAEGIDASPTGKEVWVSNRADNSLSVIDTKSRQVVQKLESQSFPIRVKFTPDGKYVLVSNARSGDVKVFDAWTKKGIKTISMNVESVAGKEERLFSDRFGKSPVPVGILIHPDGQRAYVANTNADIITVIELENWQVVNRLQAGKEPDGMGFSPIQMSDYSKK